MPNVAPRKLLVHMDEDDIRDIVADAIAANDPPSDIVDQTGAAQYLGVSLPTLRALITQGLPFVTCGAHRRFSRAEIWAWLRQREASK